MDERNESTQMAYGGRLSGGLNYFLNRHFAFTLYYGSLYYTSTTVEEKDADDEGKSTNDTFGVNLGLSSLSVGLQYFIGNASDKK